MLHKTTILLVDDDQAIRDLLAEYLCELDYSVVTAGDGLEGMEKIKQGHFDVLILDIRIPYVSGLGLLQIAREIDPHIPIVCMTGYGASPERIAAEEQVHHVLSKPFELKELAHVLKDLTPKNGAQSP